MLKQLINLFIKKNGRSPNALEMLQLKFKAAQQSGKGQVIPFPRDRITDWRKPRPTTGKKADVTETLASPTRIKQGFSTQSKLNSWSQNQKWVRDFIGKKNREFNSLSKEDQKEVLEMFEAQIKKHMPKEPLADGGLAGMLGERTGFHGGGYAPQLPVDFKYGEGPAKPPHPGINDPSSWLQGNQHPGFANLESAMQPNMSRPDFNATIDPNFKPACKLSTIIGLCVFTVPLLNTNMYSNSLEYLFL